MTENIQSVFSFWVAIYMYFNENYTVSILISSSYVVYIYISTEKAQSVFLVGAPIKYVHTL